MTDAHQHDGGYAMSLEAVRSDGSREAIRIARIDFEAPWRWLALGLRDLVAMPHIGLAYGAVFAAIAAGMFFGLATMGWQSMILALGGGFLLIGPVLAVGLYEASRRREFGQRAGLFSVIAAGFKRPRQLALLGLGLLIIFIVWMRLAFLLFMLFFGVQPFPPIVEFIPWLLFTWSGVTLLIVGSIAGAALAGIVYAMTVISAPMLLARQVGVATAVFASFNAVRVNPKPMTLWAVLIAAFMAIGIATLSLGLIVIFPLIGHATWHAYRDIAGRDDV